MVLLYQGEFLVGYVAYYKVRRTDTLVSSWEERLVVKVLNLPQYADYDLACEIAELGAKNLLVLVPKVVEVRWNFKGSCQWHYFGR